MTSNKMTKTHIEHPEDSILTGDLSFFDALSTTSHVSMKMDGMSLVWGTNPNNGRFFVCTKSAFNKKKDKKCYTHDDIFAHFGHQVEVVDILSHCLKYLPRTDNIYWGDWLGFGRTDVMTQNTLTYAFPDKIDQKLVIAPHTQVYLTQDGLFCNAVCKPLTETFTNSSIIKWVQPVVDKVYVDNDPVIINQDAISFLTDKEASLAKQSINKLIKSGQDLTDDVLTAILGCNQLANLYQLVISMKEELMDSFIIIDAPDAYLPSGDYTRFGEGFVMDNVWGTYKLVNRFEFAHANFNHGYTK